MAGSSDTFSFALSYALEQLGTPNLKAVYQGNSGFVRLPTGFGKSICYQALPVVTEYKKGQCGTVAHSAIADWRAWERG